MTAADIAAALGGGHRSGARYRCPCPAHGSTDATLALRDGCDGWLLVKCFAGCDARDVLAALGRRELFDGNAGGTDAPPDPAEIERRRSAEARERQRRIALARDMVAESRPAGGTVVEPYLREARGVLGTAPMPTTIRYLPMASSYARHPLSGGCRPVMLAVVEHVDHGTVGAHRTWLTRDGSAKASLDPVRMSTGPIGGGAVRLAPAAETMMVGEGVETCLAAMRATTMPAWAALSAAGLAELALPSLVHTVVILVDNDRNGTGERAARTAATRWLAEGRRVRLAMPSEPGTDFNDVLLGRSPARITESRDVAA
jgi:putative DNA primase/helicase